MPPGSYKSHFETAVCILLLFPYPRGREGVTSLTYMGESVNVESVVENTETWINSSPAQAW